MNRPSFVELDGKRYAVTYNPAVHHPHAAGYVWVDLHPVARLYYSYGVLEPTSMYRALLAVQTFKASQGKWSYDGFERQPSYKDPFDLVNRSKRIDLEPWGTLKKPDMCFRLISDDQDNVTGFNIWDVNVAAQVYRAAFEKFGKRSWNSLHSVNVLWLTELLLIDHSCCSYP